MWRALLLMVAAFAAVQTNPGQLTVGSGGGGDGRSPRHFGKGPGLAKKRAEDAFRLIHADGLTERLPSISYRGGELPGPSKLHGGQFGSFADGTPGWVATPYVSVEEETLEQKQRAHDPVCFNLARSDSLPLRRAVPDVRHPGCLTKAYPATLPAASVVFVFFNEPLSPLLRSITSVLDRTPPELLHEIILVDDGSEAPWTQGPLEEYLQLLPKVTLRRMPTRQGLMATRTEGARLASAEVTIFLDSHIEVNHGWIEPLLARIKEDPKHVVMPIIDSIDPDAFTYTAGGLDLVSFTWQLSQAGSSRKREDTEPMASPAMAGGLFAINTSLFHKLGGYDPEMRLYGGEEMEISLRLWMCGATLECLPCSRVGHVFRTGMYHHGQAYPVPGDVIIKNKLRAARTWMPDEYYELVRRSNSPLPPGKEIGDLSWGREIKERLHCKSFKWYLKNVFPEMFVPGDPDHIVAQGSIRNPATRACLDTLKGTGDGAKVGAYHCHENTGAVSTQSFIITKREEIRIATGAFTQCLDRANGDGLSIYGCHGGGGNQRFIYDLERGHLFEPDTMVCLEVVDEWVTNHVFKLRTAPCDKTGRNKAQEWRVDGRAIA